MWEWSHLVPQWTTGRKVKGTEACGHTVTEPGIYGSTLTCRIDNETATHIPSDTHALLSMYMPIDELVPAGRGLLGQALQTLQPCGGGRGEADQSPPNSALSFSIYISVLSLPPTHTHTHTHTHTYIHTHTHTYTHTHIHTHTHTYTHTHTHTGVHTYRM